MSETKKPVTVIMCGASDLHPYECGGGCIHCERTVSERHKPDCCWLCQNGPPVCEYAECHPERA
jgi:hypothetical protein